MSSRYQNLFRSFADLRPLFNSMHICRFVCVRVLIFFLFFQDKDCSKVIKALYARLIAANPVVDLEGLCVLCVWLFFCFLFLLGKLLLRGNAIITSYYNFVCIYSCTYASAFVLLLCIAVKQS